MGSTQEPPAAQACESGRWGLPHIDFFPIFFTWFVIFYKGFVGLVGSTSVPKKLDFYRQASSRPLEIWFFWAVGQPPLEICTRAMFLFWLTTTRRRYWRWQIAVVLQAGSKFSAISTIMQNCYFWGRSMHLPPRRFCAHGDVQQLRGWWGEEFDTGMQGGLSANLQISLIFVGLRVTHKN